MDARYDVSQAFFALEGSRDLRIDRVPRSVMAGARAHGHRAGRYDNTSSPMCGINVVLRGRGRYVEASGREHALAPGMLFHRHPGIAHVTWFDPRSDYAEFFVVFDATSGTQLLQAGLLSSEPVADIGVDPLLLDAFRHLQKRIRMPETQVSSRTVLLETLAFLNELYGRALRKRVVDPWAKALEDACLLLEHNLEERMRGEDVAAHVGMSYAAFRKRFKETTGYAPVDYRIRRRLESAQQRLMGDTVAGTAQALGYSDAYAFSAQFKAFLGVAPREFQRRMRQRLVMVPLVRPRNPTAS